MIVILEGCDNSGKSTLGKKLSADLNMSICHPGGPPADIAHAIYRCIEQAGVMSLTSHVNLIYDRVTCISDMIYRNDDRYDMVFHHFQRELLEAKCFIIYCRPSDERLKNFSDHVNQIHDTPEIVEFAKNNIERIIDDYDRLICSLPIVYPARSNIIEYNFENDSEGRLYNLILNKLKGEIENA